MNYENEDQVISLKTMAFSVLRHWRAVIAVALLLAVVLGGVRGIASLRQIQNPQYCDQVMENYSKELEDYKAELERYDFKLDMLRADISQQQNYMQHSVLMQADSRNIYVATVGLYVYAADASADIAASIADTYRIVLLGSSRMDAMAEKLGMQARYLRELIELPDEDEHSPLLTLTIRHSTEEGARLILEQLFAELESMEAEVRQITCDHTAKLVFGGVSAEVDMGLAKLQEEENDRLEDYVDEMENYLKNHGVPQMPAMPNLGMGMVVKDAVLFAALGGILGVILVVAWACAAYVLEDKVYSGEEIQGRLGIRLLGKIALSARKRTALDRWLDKKERRAEFGDPSAGCMAAMNVRNHGTPMQPILVSGSAEADAVASFVETLRSSLPELQILWYGSLLESVEAVEHLPDCGSVLLVECCKKSCYTAIAREAEAVRGMNKKLIGVVALEP